MAEIMDGAIKEGLEKLRLLSYEIEEINRRFDTVDRTGNTLDDLRVRVDYYANEMADLIRQVEQGSAPLPSHNQQAGTDMAEIMDGAIKEGLEKLRLLSYEIEEINRRFDTVDRTGNTLDDLRVRVDYYANEMADLIRQVEQGSAPLPSHNQQAGTDRFLIPMYSGGRNSLSRFLKHFYTWALSSQSEDALSHSCPVIMTGDKSRRSWKESTADTLWHNH